MNESIFVYGTLMNVFENEMANLLKKNTNRVGQGYIFGTMYLAHRLFHYPLVVHQPESNHKVFGEILQFKPNADKASIFSILDEYEGITDTERSVASEYLRKQITVYTIESKPKEITCWVYLAMNEKYDFEVIESGDFVGYINRS